MYSLSILARSWCTLTCTAYTRRNDIQDKILQSMGRGQHATVTNDGATILKSVYVDNPAAKVLVGTRTATCERNPPLFQLLL